MVFRVVGTSYKKSESGTDLVIYGEALRFDGESFVWMVHEISIHEFSGNKPIRGLECYPTEFHHDPKMCADVCWRGPKRGWASAWSAAHAKATRLLTWTR
ncbi:ATPase [Colletotrichum chrysophilum]|uniref:ATPase n=1 Tax=Colletotrichum chrysophilum TaxID=1836956 RepID=A0AAD9AK10_9PEZI|nr:ATPase [Colletotrichum chrysophilum]